MNNYTNTYSNRVNFVKHHPEVKFEQHGDLIDLGFYGLDTVFKATYYDKVGITCHMENDTLHYKEGDIFKVKLGFAMELPRGFKAQIFPRSGTRKNFNVMLTNSVGQIDNGYSGTSDEWLAEFIALADGSMKIGDRILQFEIVPRQRDYEFHEVERLRDKSRGGYGSSGI